MKTCMALLMMLSLLSGPGGGTAPTPEAGWQKVVEAVLAADTGEEVTAAAGALLDWAGSGETCKPGQVEQFLEEQGADAAQTAAGYAAVLDAADALLAAGEASVEAEDYQAAVRALSPLFTRLLAKPTPPYREEPAAYPTELSGFDGVWCDGEMQEMLIFRDGKCRVVIPYLDYYGETAYSARLRDRSAVGYCPALEVDTRNSGDFSGALTYYVSGLAGDHFWCNTQGQRFARMV